MMETFIRLFLPAYFIIYFGLAFVAKSVIVARRIGKNPFVLPKDDSAYGLIGRYFKLTLTGLFIYVLVFALFPGNHDVFIPIRALESQVWTFSGFGLLVFALIWTLIAQVHMKDSWRIGIDAETKTELITTGLFSYSRNPIFFGMILSLLGVFFISPNACSLLFLVLGYVLMQIQIRLEEEFLVLQHGTRYTDYRQKVRRLI